MSLVSKILKKWIQLDDRILKPMSNFHPEIFPSLYSKSGHIWDNSLVERFNQLKPHIVYCWKICFCEFA